MIMMYQSAMHQGWQSSKVAMYQGWRLVPAPVFGVGMVWYGIALFTLLFHVQSRLETEVA